MAAIRNQWEIQGELTVPGVGTHSCFDDQCICIGTYGWNPLPFILGWERDPPPFLYPWFGMGTPPY